MELSCLHSSTLETAQSLFDLFAAHRRISHPASCTEISCEKCRAPHLPKIEEALRRGEAPVFVLPAFPGKSPNERKVLGALPDEAERSALRFLGDLCQRARRVYAPGIRILICSDGRVFSDVVGMEEKNVSLYQQEISNIVAELRLPDVSTFNLDDCFPGETYEGMRERLLRGHGRTSAQVRDEVRRDLDLTRMYKGMTRFLFEDALTGEETRSRTALQKDARKRAYEMIRRSNAWSELIERIFPEAIRLSIHPQNCGARKLGLRLIGDESWITPWHGVLVKTPTGELLMKRPDAEALGAELQFAKGRPSHFTLGVSR